MNNQTEMGMERSTTPVNRNIFLSINGNCVYIAHKANSLFATVNGMNASSHCIRHKRNGKI